jgi:hypothetical protein
MRLPAGGHAFFSKIPKLSPRRGGLSGVTQAFEAFLQLFERDAGLAAHQEKIKNTKPDAGRCISELPLEVSVFALRLEVVGDFGSDLRRGCRGRPQIRRLPLRHLLYAASMPAARDEFFGDLFTNQERWSTDPLTARDAGCHAGQFAGVVM